MLRFVCAYDYTTIIRDAVKAMVTDSDDNRRQAAEQFAYEEMISYLLQDFDVRRIFGFNAFDLVAGTTHQVGDLVVSNDGKRYTCIEANANTDDITDATKWVEDKVYGVTEVYSSTGTFTKGDTVLDARQVPYLCIQDAPAGTLLTDTGYFWLKRNNLMVMLYIDISTYHYHARINPNQVPQLRVDRYLDAISKLKQIRKGEMTPALPRMDSDGDGVVNRGNIEMWSNKKRNNSWGEGYCREGDWTCSG